MVRRDDEKIPVEILLDERPDAPLGYGINSEAGARQQELEFCPVAGWLDCQRDGNVHTFVLSLTVKRVCAFCELSASSLMGWTHDDRTRNSM
jgi:hypothetical protein